MNIYMIGIGGIAMGNLAFMLKQAGHNVTGSDHKLYPPMSDKLKEWGLKTFEGFSEENIDKPDLVIIGNAISRGNPEVEQVLNLGLEYMSMPQAISHFFLKKKKVIVVAGTHGKTTTTFLIHHILKQAGLKPGLFAGGIRKDGNAGFELGDGDYFVIEGDEYDSAFFDKSSKFLHYRPYYLVMTSLDFDHADIFPNLDAIKIMFKRLLNLVPSKGKVFYWAGSKNLKEICEKFRHAPILDYEVGKKDSILRIGFISRNQKKEEIAFSVHTGKELKSPLIGMHNYRNTEVAANVCKTIGLAEEEIFRGIESFPGVKRRQDIIFQTDRAIVMEDFAHHPVAIEETIKAVNNNYPEHSIISLFEPRSATSHRNIFQKEFAESFKKSTLAIVTEVFNLNKVDKKTRLDVKKLVKEIPKKSKIKKAIYAKDSNDLLSKLDDEMNDYIDKDFVILAMSNGSFGGIYPELIEMIKEKERERSNQLFKKKSTKIDKKGKRK